jgi:NAD(P)-dependent dehydrogenase (short-subunit alcohol dehydrogenase family)
MNGKTILITGASTGFGRGTAETLARAGHRVFASMRDIEGRNREHAEALRRQSIEVVELDVSNDESVHQAVREILKGTSRIDVLIHRLIDLPRGQRPARTIVGRPFGADAVNRLTVPVQSEVLRSLGLGHLDAAEIDG